MNSDSININLKNIWMYLPASTPHLIGLFCAQIPFVLSENQIIHSNYTFYPINETNLEKHFVFSMKNWNEKRYHTLFTYSLVHYNMNHFYNNFISIAFCGTHIIRNAGSSIFWITYALGTVFGSLSSLIEYNYHHRQSRLKNLTKSVSKEMSKKNLWDNMTEPITEMVEHYGNKAIDTTFKSINDSRALCGSSASVYALYAFDFALTIDRATYRFKKFWNKYVRGDDTVQITNNDKILSLFDIVSLWSGIKRIQSDLEYLWFEKTNRSKMDHLIVTSPDNIAHSGHIGGFVAGILSFCVWKLYIKYKYGNRHYINSDGEEVYHIILQQQQG